MSSNTKFVLLWRNTFAIYMKSLSIERNNNISFWVCLLSLNQCSRRVAFIIWSFIWLHYHINCIEKSIRDIHLCAGAWFDVYAFNSPHKLTLSNSARKINRGKNAKHTKYSIVIQRERSSKGEKIGDNFGNDAHHWILRIFQALQKRQHFSCCCYLNCILKTLFSFLRASIHLTFGFVIVENVPVHSR